MLCLLSSMRKIMHFENLFFKPLLRACSLDSLMDLCQTGDKEKNQWKTKNTHVITWILNSVDQYIILSLRPFKTVSDI
jgi:hypothetical protein